MATDPRKLRPSELCRLLNSTPLGEVINERQLHRHRTRAGLRIGDGRFVDLLRYVAWLMQIRHEPKRERDADPYETLKERARARNAALSLAGRDIGELPAVIDPQRKEKASTDFRFFCESYFQQTFHLEWSPDHLKVIAKIEQAVLHGGLFAMAMPRGSGKTTICECACIWAVLYGHREFVCLIGSDEGHAMDMLDSIKMELDGNDLLLADFPEVVYPIQCLDGIANRCSGQLYQGERTHIGWTAREIVLPSMPGSNASGAIIKVAGITGRIRGMKYKRADGRTVRPSLVVLDDPQTDESARSLSQCATRESILAGAVLGLAGPGKKISGIMPCTVIRPGDMADNILDRSKHPQWQGERTKMVYTFPTDEKLWARYAEIRAESFRNDGDGHEATEFYRQHREEMDAGAVIAWLARHNEDELSAIQHAMNLKFRDEAAFFAEYQNEPILEEDQEEDALTADQVAGKVNGLDRGVIPIGCDHLTMFIDVQQKLLFYVVAAWADDFTGVVTLAAGHGLQLGDVVDVYWSGSGNYRFGMNVTAVNGNDVTIDGGAGTNLPAQDTAVTVAEQVTIDTDFDGDLVKMIVACATYRGHIAFRDATPTVLKEVELPAGESWSWVAGQGIANPLSGNPVNDIKASNGDSSGPAMLRIGVLYDGQS